MFDYNGKQTVGVLLRDPHGKLYAELTEARDAGKSVILKANPTLRRVLGESQQAPAAAPLEIIEGVRQEYYDICPHCQKEIYERHVYFDGPEHDKAFHSDCKGPVIWPRKRIREENAALMARPDYMWK